MHETKSNDQCFFWGVNSYLTERKWHRSWPLLQHRCWLRPLHCSGFPVPDWKWAQSRWSHRLTGLHDSDSHYPDTRSVKRRWGGDGMTVIAWGTHSAAQEALSASQRYNLHFNWSTHDLEYLRGLWPSFFYLVLLNYSTVFRFWRRFPSNENSSPIGITLCHCNTLGCSARGWGNKTYS